MVVKIDLQRSFNPIAENDVSEGVEHILLKLILDELQTETGIAYYLVDICDLIVLINPWRESWK